MDTELNGDHVHDFPALRHDGGGRAQGRIQLRRTCAGLRCETQRRNRISGVCGRVRRLGCHPRINTHQRGWTLAAAHSGSEKGGG